MPPSDMPVTGLNPEVSVLNFHAARPNAVRLNYGLGKVIAFDETGGSDQSDRKYCTEGWDFILAGGAVYDHLDFSFTPDREDGTAVPLPAGTPGGGGPKLRTELAILKKFIESFDFVRMTPSDGIVKDATISPDQSGKKPTVRVLAQAGKAYAIYVNGGKEANVTLDLPRGEYVAEWVNSKTGKTNRKEALAHDGGARELRSPGYSEDIGLRIRRR
jgi:hypothetical protein